MSAPRKIPRERLEFVEKLYLAGVPESRIQQRTVRRFEVSYRTARRYLQRVQGRLATRADEAPVDPAAILARSEQMLLEAFAAAKRKTFQGEPSPDTKTMALVAYRLAELRGVAAPKRVDVTSKGQPVQVYLPAEDP